MTAVGGLTKQTSRILTIKYGHKMGWWSNPMKSGQWSRFVIYCSYTGLGPLATFGSGRNLCYAKFVLVKSVNTAWRKCVMVEDFLFQSTLLKLCVKALFTSGCRRQNFRPCLLRLVNNCVESIYTRTATDMDGTLPHWSLKSETSRDIKKSF